MLTDGLAMNLHLGALFSSCVTDTPKCTGIEIAQSTGDGQPPIRVTDPGKDQVLLSLMTCCSFALCTSLLPQRELLLYFLSDSEETQEEPFKHLSVLYLLIGFPGTVSSEGGYFLNGPLWSLTLEVPQSFQKNGRQTRISHTHATSTFQAACRV